MPVVVQGLRELQAAYAHADRQARLGMRRTLRDVAKPVAGDAEQLALSQISGMARSPKWAKMRVGVTRNLVYVAPRQRGTHGRGPGRRPNLADLLMNRAMEPALDRHAPELEARIERAFDVIAAEFNTRGIHL